MKKSIQWFLVVALIAALPCPATCCTLCVANLRQMPTLRTEAAQSYARLVMYGRIVDSKLDGKTLGKGTSRFQVDAVLKADSDLPRKFQASPKDIYTLPKYIPVEKKSEPPQYLVFCDVLDGELDAYRGVPVESPLAAKYLQGALKLDPNRKAERLLYYFQYLENADPQISLDAFLEFAKANDNEVGKVASRLSSEKLRKWLKSKTTPPERVGLYAFLLGASGKPEDAIYLKGLLDNPDERARKAYDGILSGYIQLKPKEGWAMATRILSNGKVTLPIRLAVIRALQFHHGWKPKETKPFVLQGQKAILQQGELADLAIEDLRQWQWWDLTLEVLNRYGTKGFDAPIIKRAIIRYALSCPLPEAKKFVQTVRAQNKDLVEEVEDTLIGGSTR